MSTLIIILIIVYRKIVSPLKAPTCRFFPSCSLYALKAFGKYGFLKGGLRFLKRLLRCHPFCTGGYDPVD